MMVERVAGGAARSSASSSTGGVAIGRRGAVRGLCAGGGAIVVSIRVVVCAEAGVGGRSNAAAAISPSTSKPM